MSESQTEMTAENKTEIEADSQPEPEEKQSDPGTETAELTANEAAEAARVEEYLQMLQRTQADFENFRRRIRQEKEESLKYCSQRLVTNLLPVLDNFERALAAGGADVQSFMAGMELIFRQLKEVLEKEGLNAMPVVGEEFDPAKHEAVMQVESSTYADNTVAEELQKGYLLLDRVIRPAMVKVVQN